MAVIAVNGSPRAEGHTAALIGEVLAGAVEEGAATRLFQLGSLGFSGCTACMGCRATARCAVEDDMGQFYKAAEGAKPPRGLVVGTPIYFDHVSAQLKMWLDRLYCYTYTELGQRAFPEGFKGVVLATWEWDKEDAYDGVLDWLAERLTNYHGVEVLGKLKMSGSGGKPLAERPDLSAAAREFGRRLALA